MNVVANTVVFALSLLVLRRHSEPYFRWWVLSAGLHMAGTVIQLAMAPAVAWPPAGPLMMACYVPGSLAFWESGRRFRRPAAAPRRTQVLGATLLACALGTGLQSAGLPFEVAWTHGAILMAASEVAFAWAFWPRRGEAAGLGARLVSAGAALRGLHVLDYPDALTTLA